MDDLITPYTRMTGNHNHGWRAELTPAWVRLDEFLRRPSSFQRRVVGDGLDVSGEVPGMLTGWFRSAEGLWLGVCHYRIPYADGRTVTIAVRNQLIPAYALRRREVDHPTGR
ncbi:hypothetical protein [Allokutzneria albata]|uniref:Uncharacterized protein n=1 Tax=Allokutzneria albata TaxID=211114 RepID=A0A1G9YD10_ALLAB|nr:hypothetical protein [Allokutzneria albata]SDN06385.1 hypothetical protein SAMN04489726_4716 [Allokutzneria albata]